MNVTLLKALVALTVVFLVLAFAALAFRANIRRGYGPFRPRFGCRNRLGKFVLESNLILYSALGLLVIASLWNAWPLADMAGKAATCSECPREEVR